MLIVAVLVSGAVPGRAATDEGAKCKDAKAKAAGKNAAELLRAVGRNRKHPSPVRLDHDVSKAQSKLTKAFTKADGTGGCQTIDDAGDMRALIDAFVADVVAETDGPTTTTVPATTTTTTTIDPVCAQACCDGTNCTDGVCNLLAFETVVATGTGGALRNFRCLGTPALGNRACIDDGDDSECDFGSCIAGVICSDDFSIPCTDDSDCQGSCGEVAAINLPANLATGRAYKGGGGNSVPLPFVVPDRAQSFFAVTACAPGWGDLTLGPTTPAEVGVRRCTQGTRCDTSDGACGRDSDCPLFPGESCATTCLFGPPRPEPVPFPAFLLSMCLVQEVAEDASGTARCGGGEMSVSLPLRWRRFLNGDLSSSIPGEQACPLCDRFCAGGANDGRPCDDATDCPGGMCAAPTTCLGGPNDGMPCTPATSDATLLGDTHGAFPTSHDCPSSPVNEFVAPEGLPVAFSLASGTVRANGIDLGSGMGAQRVFAGFCRDVFSGGSLCFEGDPRGGCPPAIPPANGSPVPCDSDADCQTDTDSYESCAQRGAGAFSEAAGTEITLFGATDGGCLGDGMSHATDLVSVYDIPPVFDGVMDASFDLPAPGAEHFPGSLRLSPNGAFLRITGAVVD
jgi:hypothetical protein